MAVTGREGNCKGILGIENREENWKTAKLFAPFVANPSVRKALAEQLLGENQALTGCESVDLELFWTGMRDYIDQQRRNNGEVPTDEKLSNLYNSEFPKLREEIQRYNSRHGKRTERFNEPKEHNYQVSDQIKVKRTNKPTISTLQGLSNNLKSTEIDIVLETSEYLFIGEAKGESGFNTSSDRVLVHQLIREYVMASILVRLKNETRKVIPFVVGNSRDDLLKKNQVRFMLESKRLRKDNVLSWKDIKVLAKADS